MFLKKVKWIKAFYYFYMCVLWGVILCIIGFLGWQGYLFLTSHLFVVENPYNVEFRLMEQPDLPYLDFDEYFLKWRNHFFSDHDFFYIYNTTPLRQELQEIAFVDDFYLEKRYPDRVTVRYTVREPVMGIPLIRKGEAETYLLDAEGHVILPAEQSSIRQLPSYLAGDPYEFRRSRWRASNSIRYCLDLLEILLLDSRMEAVYWQVKGIQYEAPDEFLLTLRDGTEFSIHAQTLEEVVAVLRQYAHNLEELDGQNILIRGENE